MKALIDPRFKRVCQIEPDARIFDVAPPLAWVTVPVALETQVTTQWTFDGQFRAPVVVAPRPDPDLADLDTKLGAVPAGPIREALAAIRKVLR